MSPLWRPVSRVDELLVESKEIRLQLAAAVQELEKVAARINERAQQIEQGQEPGESE